MRSFSKCFEWYVSNEKLFAFKLLKFFVLEVFNSENQFTDRLEQKSKSKPIKLADKKKVKQDLSCC